tara:strand:- start:4967 stop:9358 length:4392 start_codon:yes stop_codon:yes gene_type:complete
LDAIQQLFDNVGDNKNLAFVVVQHLSPDFKSLMPELLAKHTKMQIFTAEDKQEIKPNCIYLNQRNKNLHIKGNRFYLSKKEPKYNLNLPIDIFFHTLGEEHKERSIGVILSGTGSDGSRGIKTIKEGGGTVIVQDPSTAQFDGMPNSAIATNLADFISAPEDIAQILEKFPGERIQLSSEQVDINQKNNDLVYFKILEKIHRETNIDFQQYKRETLLRRLEKRMNVNNIVTLNEYLDFLGSHHKEIEILKQDFLIGVTSFFRDTGAFEVIRTKVIPEITASKTDGGTIRVWTAGCSTGEEVYTLAIMLDSFIQRNRLPLDFKLFATDVDGTAISKASTGVFHENIKNEVPPEYLDQYFLKKGSQLHIIKRIRDRIVFSKHNLSKDPPFISIDLISCRNLLIYLNHDLQEKVFQDFQFSLNHHGYLFLGSSESLGVSSKYFEEVDQKWKIFRSIAAVKQVPKRLRDDKFPSSFSPRIQGTARSDIYHRYKDSPETFYYKFLSKRFSPASVFIDKDYNILFINGDAGDLLQHGEGTFEKNLLKMISPELATIVRNAIRRVNAEKQDVRVSNLITEKWERKISLDLTVSKLVEKEGVLGSYLIHFSEETIPQEKTSVIQHLPTDEISQQRFEDLEDELTSTKAELQNVVEELETSNEELQSTNEELMASNEELQTTNEELQSVNEELYTVNSEVQEKNKELVSLNNDVNNLFESTEIGTLFLDRDLNIRKFTKPLILHFSLTDNDLGRPVHSFSSSFGETVKKSILEHSRKALTEVESFEEEVVDTNGNCFLCRISPFITLDKLIDGVVITFVDISELKSKEKDLSHINNELVKAQEIAHLGSWSLDTRSGVVTWTDELFKMFGLEPGTQPPTVEEQEKYFTEDSWQRLTKTLEHTLATGEPYKIDIKLKKVSGEMAWIWASGAAERDDKGNIIRLRGIAQDITEAKRLREELLAEKQFSERVSELSPAGIFVVNLSTGRFEYFNDQCCRIFGLTRDDLTNLPHEEVFSNVHADDREELDAGLDQVLRNGEKAQLDFKYRKPDNNAIWCHVIACPFERNHPGEVTSYIGVIADVTDQKIAEGKLKESMKAAKAASIYKDQFLANMSHEIRTPLNGLVGFADLLRDDSLDPVEKNRYLDIIMGCSDQLLNLIDDILDLSKIEAGELKLDLRKCDLYKMIRESHDTFSNQRIVKEKEDINLKISVPEDERTITVLSDPLRLQQVLSNLLSNALKFSDEGTIEFGYHKAGDFIEFFVKDDGIGISEERLNLVFERFEHINGSEKKYEGTGLGLSVSKGIVELLEGDIKVESTFGQGSTFTFRIPDNRIESPEEKPAEPAASEAQSLTDLKLLIVEDENVNIIYYNALFTKMGFDFTIVENGLEAVELVKTNSHFDVILMDIQMPVMGGELATKEILSINPDAKIIAQTAYAMADDEKKYLQMGFTDYISKPIDVALLKEKLAAIQHSQD